MRPAMGKRTVRDSSWLDLAACNDDNRPPDVQVKDFDPLDYRPLPGRRHVDEPGPRRALAVCARCPVRVQCDADAKSDPHARGVRAGKYRRDGDVDAA